ncbi:STAS domain-containing protein [Krasilnikovia sp. M28-CT-15]|uniref:STAS domain-containing protein n=1 Tax=Krasilnikovia sp. M28-CT-15 TaxID=3373540 RepID=UPI0038760660
MASFEASTVAGEGRVTVALRGDCDLTARDQLTAVLLDAVGHGKPVFVDVAGVSFFDSTGVHALVTAHHAARGGKGQLFVVNAGGVVAAVLELTGLDMLLRAPAEEQRHA